MKHKTTYTVSSLLSITGIEHVPMPSGMPHPDRWLPVYYRKRDANKARSVLAKNGQIEANILPGYETTEAK